MTPSDKAPEVTADNEFVVCDPPIEFWALPYREKSERKLAFSFDGPVSPRYGAYILKSAYDSLAKELTREREICGVLREALDKIQDFETQTIYGYSGDEQLAINDAWSITADVAKEALAREKEMRK